MLSPKQYKMGGKLVLITNRKSYMSFQLVLKSVTLNNREWRNGPYFALFFSEFGNSRGVLRKSAWQSHNYGQFTITMSSSKRLQEIHKFKTQCAVLAYSYRFDKKSYMSFRLVPISVTLNDLERRNGPYFPLFYRIWQWPLFCIISPNSCTMWS